MRKIKTEELIKQAKKLCRYYKTNTPDHLIVTENDIKVIAEMTNRLEMAYEDLKEHSLFYFCNSCVDYTNCSVWDKTKASNDYDCSNWQWRGDEE